MRIFLKHEPLFAILPVILVLADRKKDTILKGRKLYPRFISHADGDFTDVAAVLEKKFENIKSKKIDRKEVN